MQKLLFKSVVIALSIYANVSPSWATSHGQDFPVSAFLSFRIGYSNIEDIEKRLGQKLQNGTTTTIAGQTASHFALAYNRGVRVDLAHSECLPEKAGELLFINGTLESYDVFSELPGEIRFGPPPLSLLKRLRAGYSLTYDDLAMLEPLNGRSSGKSLFGNEGASVKVYWMEAGVMKRPLYKRLFLRFDRKRKVIDEPIIDTNVPTYRWLCSDPPPLP